MKIRQILLLATLCKNVQKNALQGRLRAAQSWLRLTAAFVLFAVLVALPRTAHAQIVANYAGTGTAGFLNGAAATAQFNLPHGICADAAGNIYVADASNHRIRRIDAGGNVTTYAGTGTAGFANGPAATAQFFSPLGVCSDAAGNIYVADYDNHRIRRIDAGGNVTTYAGSGTAGFLNGAAATAQFNLPRAVISDAAGNIYVVDHLNHCIRRIDGVGNVTTYAGSGTAGFLNGAAATAQFNFPCGAYRDAAGNIYVADRDNHRIRRIDAGGNVTTHAGTGTAGFANGAAATAQFNQPNGLYPDAAGNIYVADRMNNRVRRIDLLGNVTTYAGSGTAGSANGAATVAQFNGLTEIYVNASGDVYVADYGNHRIRRIGPPATAAYAGTVFTEDAANNGTVTVTQDVTLTNDTWLPAGVFNATHFTAAGVPGGLTMAINRISATVARISLTGTALAHAAANNTTFTLTFANAAVASGSAVGVTGLNLGAGGLSITFTDPLPTSAAYTGTNFTEDAANNGSITMTQDVTLTNDTWVPAGAFTGTHFSMTPILTGLTMALNRISATVARISFTGSAAAHAAANNTTRTLTFTNAAVVSNNAGTVTGLNLGAGGISFTFSDATAAFAGSTTFAEAPANNGTITNTPARTITLTGDTWAAATLVEGTHFSQTGRPAGLTLSVVRGPANVATISFTGTATNHTNAQDATVNITFNNNALVGNNAGAVGSLNPTALAVDFNDPFTAVYSGTTFPEAAANDGSITQTHDVTLSGDTWVPVGTFATPADFTVSGVPTGLTIAINRISATVARISFTGTAAAHAAANNATVTVTFNNASVASGSVASNIGLSPVMLSLTFDNPPAPPPPPPPPPVAPTLTGGMFGGSVGVPFGANLSASGNPTPSLSVSAGALPSGVSLVGNSLTGVPGEQGTFTFTVQASNSVGNATASVTVNIGPAVAQVTGISPATGTFGSTVTITGFNLGGTTSVTVGGVPVQSFTALGNTIVAVLGMPGTGNGVSISTPLGNASGAGFTYEQPPAPVINFTGGSGSSSSGGANVGLPAIPSGDSNAGFFLPGQNIPVYANISITPISSTGATTGFATPVQIVGVSSTGASLLIPAFALLPGAQRLTVQVGTFTVSTTFAIVRAAQPMITGLSVRSTTASGEGFATILSGSGFFRNGLAKVFVNDEESFFSQVLSASQVQVHIPAQMNVRRGIARIRLQNFDGQSTSASVEIIGRNAPLILSVTPKRTNRNLSFIVRGVAFSPRLTAVLGRSNVQVVNASDTEFEVLVPSDFNVGGSATVLLLITNPDGQRYGFLIAGEAFQSARNGGQGTESSTEAAREEESPESSSLLRSYPNPATETVSVEVPASLKARRYSVVNALGEEVFSGTVAGDEALVLDVRRLVKGLYTVRVVGASRVRAAQVIVR